MTVVWNREWQIDVTGRFFFLPDFKVPFLLLLNILNSNRLDPEPDPELLPGSGTRKIQSWIRIRNKSFQTRNAAHYHYQSHNNYYQKPMINQKSVHTSFFNWKFCARISFKGQCHEIFDPDKYQYLCKIIRHRIQNALPVPVQSEAQMAKFCEQTMGSHHLVTLSL